MALSTVRVLTVASVITFSAGTSSKMDFLALGHVRTDPIVNEKCFSDHVHTFYGPNVSLAPSTTYKDLRAAKGSTGNAKENLSLYWHPSIYKLVNGVYTLVNTWFATAYYIWDTGKAKAFPDGFKMIASAARNPLGTRWHFDCDGVQVNWTHPNSSSPWGNFPNKECGELEMRIVFPTCWDGRTTSSDHMSHVAYTLDGSHNGPCPDGYSKGPLPEIQLYFRIKDYSGEQHVFSNGMDMIHADYFSGWDEKELQNVLDSCSNSGEAAMPDKWCENHLTFKDAPKTFVRGGDNDPQIVYKLKTKFQTVLPDTAKINPEKITNITVLPRGGCNACLYQGTCYSTYEGQIVTEDMCSEHYPATQWCGTSIPAAEAQAIGDTSSPSSLQTGSAVGHLRKPRKTRGLMFMQTGTDDMTRENIEVDPVSNIDLHNEASLTVAAGTHEDL